MPYQVAQAVEGAETELSDTNEDSEQVIAHGSWLMAGG